MHTPVSPGAEAGTWPETTALPGFLSFPPRLPVRYQFLPGALLYQITCTKNHSPQGLLLETQLETRFRRLLSSSY